MVRDEVMVLIEGYKELSGRGDVRPEGWEERRACAKEDGGGFGVAAVRRTERAFMWSYRVL